MTFLPQSDGGIKAPHFVFFIREYLEEKYGADVVANGGLKVITTLDYELQEKAEELVRKYALRNDRSVGAENAALVALEPSTGHILSMVGSRGYFDEEIDGKFNVATAARQPGSVFKPIVYATAFDKGYTPETIVFDVKTQFSTQCEPNDFSSEPPCYSPENYDNVFSGPVSLRQALAQSKNIPAVKVLFLAGLKDSLAMAQNLGLTTLTRSANHYGLSLVLGGGEVTLLELVGAYGIFANDGVRNPTTGILSVHDSSGELLEEHTASPTRVMNAEVVRTLNDVLSDNDARVPAFRPNSPLYFPGLQVAAKTGTTNDFRDVWTIGFTPSIAAGVWGGNNNNESIDNRVASFVISPLWHEFMEFAFTKYPPSSFIPPAPDTNYETLPPVLRGNWNTDPSRGVHDILYWIDPSNPRVQRIGAAWGEEQFVRWDYPVSLWANQNPVTLPGTGSLENIAAAPTQGGAQFQITYPQNGTSLPSGSLLTVTTSHTQPESVTRVAFYLNGTYLGGSTRPPFSLSILPTSKGQSTIRAVAESQLGTIEDTVVFNVQ